MGVNALVFLIFLYIIDVNSHLRRPHHDLKSQSYDKNTDELQSVLEDTVLNTGRFKHLKDIKSSKIRPYSKYDIYNPVARTVLPDYKVINNIYNLEDLLYGNEYRKDMSDDLNPTENLPITNVNHINSDNPTINNVRDQPNGNHQELKTQGNNPSNVPESSAQVNTGNLYVVPPRDTNAPLATIPIVSPGKSDINIIPNYAIVNINGQPTLVQVINAPAIDLSNSVQTVVPQGDNGQYILLQTPNVPLINLDNTGQKPDRSGKILDNNGNANNQATEQSNEAIKFNEEIRNNPESATLQSGFVNYMLYNEIYKNLMDPR